MSRLYDTNNLTLVVRQWHAAIVLFDQQIVAVADIVHVVIIRRQRRIRTHIEIIEMRWRK